MVQFLDSDDLLAPGKIELQMAVAQKSPKEIAVVFSSWQKVAGEEDRVVPVEETTTPQLDVKPQLVSLLITKNNTQLGCLLVRREWLERSGGFDEQMPINQDLGSLMRIAHVGGGFRFAPSSGPVLFQRAYPEQPRCLIPDFDGAFLSHESKDALWDKFYTAAPPRQSQSVEQYKIVKRA
jgi:hypothetical protein